MTDAIRYVCEKCGGRIYRQEPDFIPTRRCAGNLGVGCGGYWLVGTEHLRLRILGVEGDMVRFQIAAQKWRWNEFAPWMPKNEQFHRDRNAKVTLWNADSVLCSVLWEDSIGSTAWPLHCDAQTVRVEKFLRLASAVQSYCEKAAAWEKEQEKIFKCPECGVVNRWGTCDDGPSRFGWKGPGLSPWATGHCNACCGFEWKRTDDAKYFVPVACGEKEQEAKVKTVPTFEEWHEYGHCPSGACDGNVQWGPKMLGGFANHTCREVFEARHGNPAIRCEECGADVSGLPFFHQLGGATRCDSCFHKRKAELAAVEAEDEKAKAMQTDTLRERHAVSLWNYRTLYEVARKILADPATTRETASKSGVALEAARHKIVCLEAELSLVTYDLLAKIEERTRPQAGKASFPCDGPSGTVPGGAE